MGSYAQAYTLYSSVRPFGITAIIAGWDSEAELPVDGQVGSGPKVGSGGKEGAKHGGPSLYMIEPSGMYWVCLTADIARSRLTEAGLLWRRNGQGPSDRQVRAREAQPPRWRAFTTGGCQGGSAHHLRCTRRQQGQGVRAGDDVDQYRRRTYEGQARGGPQGNQGRGREACEEGLGGR
jgi:hypothetical protein